MNTQIPRELVAFRAASNTYQWLVAEADHHLYGSKHQYVPNVADMTVRMLSEELPDRWNQFQSRRRPEIADPASVAQRGLFANLRILRFASSARMLWICGIVRREGGTVGKANLTTFQRMKPFIADERLPASLPPAEDLDQDYDVAFGGYFGTGLALAVEPRELFQDAFRLTMTRLVWQYDQCGFMDIPEAGVERKKSGLWVRDDLEDLAAAIT